MTDRELMQMALDTLRKCTAIPTWPSFMPVIKDFEARLAQPEPEPVAWLFQNEETGLTECVDTQQVEWGFEKNNPRWQKIAPLYTAPPQREWQGLTDEEIGMLTVFDGLHHIEVPLLADFARAIEAKLKEKNT